MRSQRFAALIFIVLIVGLAIFNLRNSISTTIPFDEVPQNPFGNSLPEGYPGLLSTGEKSHPIAKLISSANDKFDKIRSQQSRTLAEAVKEYRRRYQVAPPPHFDKWFHFAQSKGVQLIDEYDTIFQSLLPFWALPPKVIRQRAQEAIGFENAVIALLIRDGKVSKIEGGGDGYKWQRQALTGMMKNFIQYLPDMDLVFNTHDEPRVIIPGDDLQRMVSYALNVAIPATLQQPSPLNMWSKRPTDVNKGDRIDEVRTTRFNRFAHQATWSHSRASCPANSPARSLEENPLDDITPYAYGDLGFIYNATAFSDICYTPSLRNTFGFFDRPNAFDITADLFPIFSQSKISSFQDILYPSPWYWSGKVRYDAHKDYTWEEKAGKMYWRGSTTGGFSRAGGWRRQHRQIFVKKVNAPDATEILTQQKSGEWVPSRVKRESYNQLFDIKFTFIGQCDPDDCNQQKEFFEVAKPVDQQDAWAYKYLLDIDGNAFSGRYYAFLLSNSLVYKLALFREWHDEWLKPWVHYVPLGLRGTEYVESIRYFVSEDDGKIQGPRLAKQGKEWAEKALRNEDLEAWFFRLLLE